MHPTTGVIELNDFPLQCGVTLPRARLAFATYGELNAARSNAILYPTSYAAQHTDIDWLIGPERVLDPTRYFIVIANMFGNGLSTSPSNLEAELSADPLNLFSHVDNARAQRELLAALFGVERLKLIYGWSMGAQQAYHWGVLFPEQVERIVAVCGTARTSPHNKVFLEGLRATLLADPAWSDGNFIAKPVAGLKAYGRVYAGWALSQAFYREATHLKLGYESLEDFLVRDWEASFLKRDARNLLSMLNTWLRSDVSANDQFRGNLPAALANIKAQTLVMPCSHDLYFTPEDCRAEAELIPGAELRVIPSIWGHRAGNPAKNPADEAFLRDAVKELLTR